MPRFKDLPKTHVQPYRDADLQDKLKYVEQELKGSVLVGGPIPAEPAIMQRPPEVVISEELDNLKAGLLEVKKDLKIIKDIIEKIQSNGLRMKPQW